MKFQQQQHICLSFLPELPAHVCLSPVSISARYAQAGVSWLHLSNWLLLPKPGLAFSTEHVYPSLMPSFPAPPVSPLRCSALANFACQSIYLVYSLHFLKLSLLPQCGILSWYEKGVHSYGVIRCLPYLLPII